jgi:hypothetical protein
VLCWFATNKRQRVPGGWRYLAGGRYVAGLQQTYTGTGDAYAQIRLYDARAGTQTRAVDIGGFGDPRYGDLVGVSSCGSLVWTETLLNPQLTAFVGHELHRSSADETDVLIDASSTLDVLSVAALPARGSVPGRVSGLRDGLPRAASWP